MKRSLQNCSNFSKRTLKERNLAVSEVANLKNVDNTFLTAPRTEGSHGFGHRFIQSSLKKILLGLLFIAFFGILITAQEDEHNFTKTKQLIDSGISCSKLTNEQLEEIGDYYMEQMHPGEAHELMDGMMGGEGSESLKQVHISIAKRIYCNENVGGMMGGGMMAGGGMMGNYNNLYQNNFFGFQIFFYIILILVVIVIILIIILLANKSRKNIKQKRRSNKDERQQ